MKRKLMILLLATALVLSGCNMPTGIVAGSPTALQAWIDAPLDGTTLPLQPYSLTLHASDPGGVGQLEVSINGQVLATLANPNPASLLMVVTQVWNPSEPGRYVITARAQNNAGAWSTEDTVTVEIEDTSTPTFTPTASPTNTPTPSPTNTPTPSPLTGFASPPIFDLLQLNLPYSDCPGNHLLTAEIKVNSSQGIAEVMLFYRLENKDNTQFSDWANLSMTSVGANLYRRTFDPVRDGGLLSWLTPRLSFTWEGWVSTQFIIQDITGRLIRSDVFRQVKVGGCK
jgi:hypothetical protein